MRRVALSSGHAALRRRSIQIMLAGETGAQGCPAVYIVGDAGSVLAWIGMAELIECMQKRSLGVDMTRRPSEIARTGLLGRLG